MTLAFLGASASIFETAEPFGGADILLAQLQPVLARLAPYLLGRDRLQPFVVGVGLLTRKARL